MVRNSLLLASALLGVLGLPAFGFDVDEGFEAPLPNPDFDLTAPSFWGTDPGGPWLIRDYGGPQPAFLGPNAKVMIFAGDPASSHSMWTTFSPNSDWTTLHAPTQSNYASDRMAFGGWVNVPSPSQDPTGTIRVRAKCKAGSLEYPMLDTTFSIGDFPAGQWVYISARNISPTAAATNGGLVAGANHVTFSVSVDAAARIYFDGFRAGIERPQFYSTGDPSFEESFSAWTLAGGAQISPPAASFFENDSYYGERHLILPVAPTGPEPEATQNLPIDEGLGSPRNGQEVEASAFVFYEGPKPNVTNSEQVEIQLVATTNMTGITSTIASKTLDFSAAGTPVTTWIPIKTTDLTPSLHTIPLNILGYPVQGLRMRVVAHNCEANIRVDLFQSGEWGALHGNPEKFAITEVISAFRAGVDVITNNPIAGLELSPNVPLPIGLPNGYLGDLDYNVYPAPTGEQIDSPGPSVPILDPREYTNIAKSLVWKWWSSAHLPLLVKETFYVDPTSGNQIPANSALPAMPPQTSEIGASAATPPADFYHHDPTWTTRRNNGRRDTNTSMEPPTSRAFQPSGEPSQEGMDQVPLSGAYRSSDIDVAAWQLRMISAAGLDAIAIESVGLQIAQNKWGSLVEADGTVGATVTGASDAPRAPEFGGRVYVHPKAPVEYVGMDTLYFLADHTDIKVMPVYGLGAHMGTNGGWLGHANKDEQEAGLVSDIELWGYWVSCGVAT